MGKILLCINTFSVTDKILLCINTFIIIRNSLSSHVTTTVRGQKNNFHSVVDRFYEACCEDTRCTPTTEVLNYIYSCVVLGLRRG